MFQDIISIFQWWAVLLVLGVVFLPTTKLLFPRSPDIFYVFSKIIGLGAISYILFLFGTLHILPFTLVSIFGVLLISLIINIYIVKKILIKPKITISKIIIFEEFLFLICIISWAFVRGNEPSIHGLEKYMDFGFVNSILRTNYFPPPDMWFTPYSINYYFFGHLATAVLTRLSGLTSQVTYNLMIATLFAFCLIGGFSLLFNFLFDKGIKKAFIGGILGGLLISLSGNLHTIYSFFVSYVGEKPVPFWTLTFLPNTFPNGYWYPNATRFIPYTIHEFPLYSFVVSDLHGHVLDIPFVLLALAILFSTIKENVYTKMRMATFSLILAVMYMTNVWDSAIYMLLLGFVLLFVLKRKVNIEFYKSKFFLGFPKIKKINGVKNILSQLVIYFGGTVLLFILFTLPFSLSFKPFVSGIGIICAPEFLINYKQLGPFLFEADHCQKSPLYQLLTLYGFFIFFAASFLFFFIKDLLNKKKNNTSYSTNIFIFLLILLSTLLIIVPEFIYAKDIYPQHYRANTMFKLVYQSFMLLSLVSAYVIITLTAKRAKTIMQSIFRFLFLVITIILLFLVFSYPYFAIKSYYADLKNYQGINGTEYLKTLHPGDLEAITYLNSNVPSQPVILEAQGDSYTDYARISANTGLPTVLGWTVHEWLWRGTYDIPSPRIDEVKSLYEKNDIDPKPLLKKYNISYVIIGNLEREKYPLLDPNKFNNLGDVVFKSNEGNTIIYKLKEF